MWLVLVVILLLLGGSNVGLPWDHASGAPRSSTGQNALVSYQGDAEDEEEDEVKSEERAGSGGRTNQVRVVNRVDDRLRIKANIQLNRITGETVSPVNIAYAEATCTDCQTIAVALQINLVEHGASTVTPENYAIAINQECTRCETEAIALQYVYSVDDPREVPRDVRALIREMERELKTIARDETISYDEALERIDAVVTDFSGLADSLKDDRDEATARNSPGKATPPALFASPDPSTPSTGDQKPETSETPEPVTETSEEDQTPVASPAA